ncbi:MAG: amidohydrolase [Chloroflexi bacterium]|nr:amidohydrolase [Chloroflexota bacterium]
MLIDFHLHLSRSEHEREWVLKFIESQNQTGEDIWALIDRVLTPEGLRPFLQQHGIDWAVALAEDSPATVGSTPHDYVADLCAAVNAQPDPPSGPRGRVIPFASLNPFIVNDLSIELERLVKECGFRGIKAYPVYQHHYMNDTRMYPLYAKAQDLGVPMLVHTGSSVFKGARIKYGDPLHLDDVAIDFPKLTILMAHSGRPFWYEQAFWMARQHENVYMELSGLPGKKLLDYFPDLERAADKVVYGSDWPGNPDLRRNVEAILNLPLKDATKEKILWKNAARILGVEVRG